MTPETAKQKAREIVESCYDALSEAEQPNPFMPYKRLLMQAIQALLESSGTPNKSQKLKEWPWVDFPEDSSTWEVCKKQYIEALLEGSRHEVQAEPVPQVAPNGAEVKPCTMCGTPVYVAGEETKYYVPVSQPQVAVSDEEIEEMADHYYDTTETNGFIGFKAGFRKAVEMQATTHTEGFWDAIKQIKLLLESPSECKKIGYGKGVTDEQAELFRDVVYKIKQLQATRALPDEGDAVEALSIQGPYEYQLCLRKGARAMYRFLISRLKGGGV